TDLISICAISGAKLMEVDLLIKVQVLVGPLSFARKPGVIDAGCVCIPGSAATSRWVLDMSNGITQLFAVCGIIEMEGAIFASAFGERDGKLIAVERRFKPINRGRALSVELIGID